MAKYIGVNARPEICPPIQIISPANQTTTAPEYKALTKCIEFFHETEDKGIDFVPLDLESTRLVILSDASFENTYGIKSQIG